MIVLEFVLIILKQILKKINSIQKIMKKISPQMKMQSTL